MANKLIVDWKEYNLIVEKLAVKIHESGFKPTMLIGIMRGVRLGSCAYAYSPK